MRKLSYLAVFEPTETGYSVYFPDLPGCITCGKDFEDAQRQAVDALGLHIYGMEKDGDKLPTPSKKPVIDADTVEGYLVSLVTVFPDMVRDELDNKRVKTNVTLPTWLKDVAEQHNVNYSRILETALIDYLGVRGGGSQQPRA